MPAAAHDSPVSRNALVILAVIASGAALYWLAGILTPLALAIFLSVMIDGLARVLKRRVPGLSSTVALIVALVVSVVLFGAAAFVVAENAPGFVSQFADFSPKMNVLLARLAGVAGMAAPPSFDELLRQFEPTKYVGQVAKSVQNFGSTALFVLIYLGFIIASRHGFQRKVVGLFAGHEERKSAIAAFLRIRNGVERYLWVQTITGLMVAGASWAAMAAVGLHDALFWSFLIFLAVYIPVIGGLFAGCAPPLFALLQFDSYWPGLILFILLQTIGMVVGNIIYPRMQGRSLNIDPIVVLLALALWGALWGVAGMFLSTPLTVMMMVILAQFEGARWLAVLLSSDGDPAQLKNQPLDQSPDEKPAKPKRGRKTTAAGGLQS